MTETPTKTYTVKELRDLYGGVSRTLFAKWINAHIKELKKLGWKSGQRRYTVAQVELLFSKLGRP